MPIKRIAFLVTRGDSIGGAQIHVRDLSRALTQSQVEVLVLTGTSGDLTRELDASGIPWKLVRGLQRSINPFKDLAAIFEVAGLLKKYKPELLSCHTAKSGFVGRWAAFLAGVPSLFTAHGWQFAEGINSLQRQIVLAVEKVTSWISPRVITVSQYDYDLAVKYKVVPKEKLRLIHNGMPGIPGYEKGKSSQHPVKLIMIARFQEQKDHRTLLQALKGLEDLPWVLDLVGDGPLLTEIQDLSAQLGLDSRVHFLGQRMDVPALLTQSDIFILSTHWEGFPRSILEAMSAGLPVVATDVGGVRESVQNDSTGYLVKEKDISGLAEKLQVLITEEKIRRDMGQAGYRRYIENFTFEAMFEKTKKVYVEVIGKRTAN